MTNVMVLENTAFAPLTNDELMVVDGGTVWGVIGGALTVVAGTCAVIAGVATLLAPEPTGVTKAIGWACIVGGVATIGAGICWIIDSV